MQRRPRVVVAAYGSAVLVDVAAIRHRSSRRWAPAPTGERRCVFQRTKCFSTVKVTNKPAERPPIPLLAGDHSAHASMKSAASCDKQCELQDTLNIGISNAHCGMSASAACHARLRVELHTQKNTLSACCATRRGWPVLFELDCLMGRSSGLSRRRSSLRVLARVPISHWHAKRCAARRARRAPPWLQVQARLQTPACYTVSSPTFRQSRTDDRVLDQLSP